ncbi:MAG TPA: T9SS type A sorting domain-containing protein [Edaphocola sp.]|nr:T9SS type A sorting domain-containing protein [Edaphocola sp.]
MKRFLLHLVMGLLSVSVQAQLHKAEYFIDTDPGFGMATNIPVTAGQDISFSFNHATTGLSSGLHRLFVRTKDANGKWSLSIPQLFYYEAALSNPLANINKAEYFIDTDPGFGMATDIPVTVGQDISFSFNHATTGLSSGLHRLFVRTKDGNGKWSLSIPQLFYYEAALSNPLANINKAEYFIDTDPGFGMATDIPVTVGQDINFSFNHAITGLSSGLHRLFVRTKDANGKWSLSIPQLFYYEAALSNPLANINKAEYFIDTDPGFGLATNIPVTAGQDISFSFNHATTGLSSGLHRLFVRTKDANGKWSLSIPQLFYYEAALSNPLANINKAEYFIDTDPGFGMATNIPVSAGQDISFSFNHATTGLSSGLHRLFVRTRDANGNWSLSIPQLFYYEAVESNPLVNIVKMEYFFDTDPGFGNANNIPFTANQDVTVTFGGSIATLSYGLHRLLIRAKDANGKWSVTTNMLFYKEQVESHTPGNLVKLEWFWDTDPGFGNGNTVMIPGNQTEIINFGLNIPVSGSMSNQIHNLFIRVLDDWSLTTVVQVDFSGLILPISLLSFNAKSEGNHVKTWWEVANELDMDKYIVERSVDGKTFEAIGEHKAIGNNKQHLTYTFYDESPFKGLNYYRLKQVENSGNNTYSPIVKILFSDGSEPVSVFPNPAKDYFQIKTTQAIKQVKLVDLNGKLVKHYAKGEQYSLSGIISGTYLVRIEFENAQIVTKPLTINQ